MLADDGDDPTAAVKLLEEVIPRLRRNDLVYQIREAIKAIEK